MKRFTKLKNMEGTELFAPRKNLKLISFQTQTTPNQVKFLRILKKLFQNHKIKVSKMKYSLKELNQ